MSPSSLENFHDLSLSAQARHLVSKSKNAAQNESRQRFGGHVEKAILPILIFMHYINTIRTKPQHLEQRCKRQGR